ncbi:unnamed protein product [Lupinus luteus]|uniref:Inositol-tetrakisphosphate 1-kinase n=1 Tax=Lupinus luteus TaxID=3873 RepID=A0AAV1XHW3_LUPLU
MRVDGEISEEEEPKEEEFGTTSFSCGECSGQKKVVVGYALTSKKKKSFLQPKLITLARNKGIYFVAIDINKPLLEQGSFDILLHKLSGEEWREIIEGQIVEAGPTSKVGIPQQLVISKEKNPFDIPHEVTKAGLKLPLVAKPLLVDGSAKSHELFLAYDESSLSELEPPLVLQEFVNHGGILFKIYIVGETIKVVRRFSLPNISKHELSKVAGVYRFPRVSCAAASADDADLDPSISGEIPKTSPSPTTHQKMDYLFHHVCPYGLSFKALQEATGWWRPVIKFCILAHYQANPFVLIYLEYPPRPLLERLARELRHRLGLCLFNIDMIREHGSKGYGKMPDYELIFTDFLLSLVQSKFKNKNAT